MPPRAGPRQPARRLSDALGTSPSLPDTRDKKGAGTFETLTGNPFRSDERRGRTRRRFNRKLGR